MNKYIIGITVGIILGIIIGLGISFFFDSNIPIGDCGLPCAEIYDNAILKLRITFSFIGGIIGGIIGTLIPKYLIK